MTKPSIVVTSELSPHPGGIGKYTEHFSRALSDVSKTVVISFSNEVNIKKEDIYNYHSNYNYKLILLKTFNIRLLDYVYRLLSIFIVCLIYRPKHIFPTGLRASYYTLPLALLGFKVWFVGHGSEFIQYNKKLQLILKKSFMIIVNGEYTKSLLFKNYKVCDEKVSTIPLGGDDDVYYPFHNSEIAKFKDKLNISQSTKVLLSVGRVDDRKAQDFVIDFLASDSNIWEDIVYIIVGLEKDNGFCRNKAIELGVFDKVKFCGFVADNELPSFYNLADVYLQPSRYSVSMGQVEGFGIAICEAGLCGTPSIGTDSSGTKDAIEQGVNGILIKEDSIEDLSNALLQIINNGSCSSTTYMFAKQHLTWSTFRDTVRKNLIELQ